MVEAYLGEIRSFATNRIPAGWVQCAGQSLPIDGNQALYSLLGNSFGASDVSFSLPDLRGRVPIGRGTLHDGQKEGGNYALGAAGGLDKFTLPTPCLPVHRHDMMASTAEASSQVLASGVLADTAKTTAIYGEGGGPSTVQLSATSVGTGGGGQEAKQNMQPFMTSAYCICIMGGVFPTRG